MKQDRGAATAELLVGFFPALLVFLAIWQLSELLVGRLLVERASSAAARAAAVVLPDDPAFYENVPVHAYEGQRRRDVELAAGMILAISPHFTSNFTVDVSGAEGGFRIIEATVDAEFRCILGGAHCGGSGSRRLKATASHVYHGAEYSYDLSFDAAALLTSECAEPSPIIAFCMNVTSPRPNTAGTRAGRSTSPEVWSPCRWVRNTARGEMPRDPSCDAASAPSVLRLSAPISARISRSRAG